MLIVGAEEHVVRGQLVLHDLAEQLLDAVGRGAHPDQDPHTGAELFQYLLIVGAFVIRGGAGHPVGVQLHAGKQRSVAVDGLALKQPQLIQHLLAAVHGGHIVHDLPQAQDAALVDELFHVLRHQLRAAVLKGRGGHAAGHHKHDPKGQVVRELIHGPHPGYPRHIGDLVGVCDDGGGAMGHHHPGKALRDDHGRLDMHMPIDEAGA